MAKSGQNDLTEREERIEEEPEDDDEWMEWETRKSDMPILMHMIAGKSSFLPLTIRFELTFLFRFVQGSCAGVVEHCCMFPVDTIKVSFTTN